MRFNDAILGVVLLIFGAAVVLHSRGFPGLPGQNYGPAFFPSIIGVALGLCGVILVVQGILTRREVGLVTLGEWASSPRHRGNFFIVILALLFYVLFSKPLGFIPTSLLITTVLMVRFGVRLLPAGLMAVASTLVIHTAFYKFLLVPLPWGILTQVAW
ncbi:MAG: tripartite tricarboxylate transporter TctB family protein [Rhodospirillales bacterium]|nr:tripartite tricarboxylate transporter TctB family protein [Rhodospirillales bacterium]